MRKILIVGKYGQIAQAFSQLPMGQDNIRCYERTEFDITKPELLEEKILAYKPTHIINTSAFHVLSDCEKFPLKACDVNTIGVLNLAKLCKHHAIPFITFSTDYVFDGETSTPYQESDTPNPLQVYGISKVGGEYATLNYYPEGTYVIRTSSIYGGKEGSRDKKGNFVLTILKEAEQSNIISIGSSMTMSPTYATDLAIATCQLIEHNASPGIYHLTNEGSCTWVEFAQEIINYANLKNTIHFVEKHAIPEIRKPKFSALANIKAKKIGIELPHWQDALQRYILHELRYE